MMKLSDYVASFVARHARHVFYVPGGGCMHLCDSIGNQAGIEAVSCIHEQACTFAAEAYGEYTNRLGVALVTSGPGGTNAVTGVAAAWVESSGCLVISGQAKRADLLASRGVRTMGQQELDIVPIVRPITKYAVSVMNPATIRYHLEKAVYLATHGRPGPTWIDIPLDVQAAQIDETHLVGFSPQEQDVHPGSDSLAESVGEVLKLVGQSRRPVFLFGNGVRSAGAIDILNRVLERIRIPVLLTWKAADFLPDDHPCFIGRPGGIGQRAANFTQQNSDCIVVVGARLDLPSVAFDHKGFARAARKVMVDVDPAEIWKMETPIDVPICADAGVFLSEMLRQSSALDGYSAEPWLRQCREWTRKYPVVLPEHRRHGTGSVSAYALIEVLSEQLGSSDLIVPGSSGACSDILMQAFRAKTGQRILNAPGLGAMGTGLPGAMGACLASGRRRTVCVNGDGGFFFNVQTLEPIRRLGLPIKFFVLNNNGYGSIASSQKHHFKRLVGANPDSGTTLPDIRQVASAFGIRTLRIADNADLHEVVGEALAADGPVVCEVMVSPDEQTQPRVASRVLPDGRVVSSPMEDMSPLLDREDLAANMLIPTSPRE